MMVIRDQDRVRLISRGGHDWAKRFPLIVSAALKLRGARGNGPPFRCLLRSALLRGQLSCRLFFQRRDTCLSLSGVSAFRKIIAQDADAAAISVLA
jgi:hypothetical protein